MDTALKLTTDYLKTRKQFGVTLNRFQALTFRAADMYISLELARSIVSWAIMVLADDDSDAEKKSRGGVARQAAGQPRRPAHRPGGHPAARRHRHDRGVRRRPLHQPAHRDRPPARRRPSAGQEPLAPADVVRRGRAAAVGGSACLGHGDDPNGSRVPVRDVGRQAVRHHRDAVGGAGPLQRVLGGLVDHTGPTTLTSRRVRSVT